MGPSRSECVVELGLLRKVPHDDLLSLVVASVEREQKRKILLGNPLSVNVMLEEPELLRYQLENNGKVSRL